MDHQKNSNITDGVRFDDGDVQMVLLEHYEDRNPPSSSISPIWFSKRFLVTFLLFLGCVNMHSLRGNVSIAVVEMTSNRTFRIGNETITKQPEYNWDSRTVALVISMFPYGYLFCVLGGLLATKFGGSVTYGTAMMMTSIITLLNPCSLYANFYLFLLSRALAGLTESLAYASTAEILTRWAPINERSTLMSFTFSGGYVGAAVTYPFCGYIAHRWGWPMVFYTTGSVCFTWAMLWLIIVRNEPSKDKWISKQELSYIKERVETTPRKQIVHPYRSIFTSAPFWALCFAKFSYNWGYTLLVICFPLYVKDMTKRSTDEIGLISAIPNFVCVFAVPIIGTLMDFLQNHTNFKINQVHKVFMSFGFISASCLFVITALVDNFTISMICFIFIKIFLAFNFLLVQVVNLYMAPKHSGVLAALTAFWYIVSSILSPTIVGFIVTHHKWEEWSTCFFLASGILMLGAIIFMIFGSSELQPWASTQVSQNQVALSLSNRNKSTLKN